MKLVVATDPGDLELNYTWLPTWSGINNQFKNEMEKVLKDKLLGTAMDERGLEKAHKMFIEYICERNQGIKGLYEYLEALKYVDVE